LTNMSNPYKQGFEKKCELLGFNPDAVWSFGLAFIKEARRADLRADNEKKKKTARGTEKARETV